MMFKSERIHSDPDTADRGRCGGRARGVSGEMQLLQRVSWEIILPILMSAVGNQYRSTGNNGNAHTPIRPLHSV